MPLGPGAIIGRYQILSTLGAGAMGKVYLAYQDRSFFLIWLKVEPQFDSLRDDPRFQDLLRRVGLLPLSA